LLKVGWVGGPYTVAPLTRTACYPFFVLSGFEAKVEKKTAADCPTSNN
jgi:hypothetical protein